VLLLTTPTSGARIAEPVYTVRGTTQNVSHVTIQGEPILMNADGTFEALRVTPEGYGVLQVEAWNRFGKRTSTILEIVGTPPLATSTPSYASTTPSFATTTPPLAPSASVVQ
jgi:hypothetical protein